MVVAILLGLRLVKEAVKTYIVKGYLFNALLLIKLKFLNGNELLEVLMAHLLASY